MTKKNKGQREDFAKKISPTTPEAYIILSRTRFSPLQDAKSPGSVQRKLAGSAGLLNDERPS